MPTPQKGQVKPKDLGPQCAARFLFWYTPDTFWLPYPGVRRRSVWGLFSLILKTESTAGLGHMLYASPKWALRHILTALPLESEGGSVWGLFSPILKAGSTAGLGHMLYASPKWALRRLSQICYGQHLHLNKWMLLPLKVTALNV